MNLIRIAAAFFFANLIVYFINLFGNVLYNYIPYQIDKKYQELEEINNNILITINNDNIDIKELMKTSNLILGKDLIKQCISCHPTKANAPSRVGPNLWNITNKKKGTVKNYKYSNALINKGGIWDDRSLFAFLRDPNQYIPGTKMPNIKFEKPEDIINIIAYLKTLTD